MRQASNLLVKGELPQIVLRVKFSAHARETGDPSAASGRRQVGEQRRTMRHSECTREVHFGICRIHDLRVGLPARLVVVGIAVGRLSEVAIVPPRNVTER